MHNPWTSPGSICGQGTNRVSWSNCRTDYALLTYIPLKSFSISVIVSPPLCTNKFLPAIMLTWDSSGHALLGHFAGSSKQTEKRSGPPLLLRQQSLLLNLSPDHSSSQTGQLMSHLPIRGSFLGCGRPSLAQSWQELGTTSWERVSAPLLMPLMWGFFSLSCH